MRHRRQAEVSEQMEGGAVSPGTQARPAAEKISPGASRRSQSCPWGLTSRSVRESLTVCVHVVRVHGVWVCVLCVRACILQQLPNV
jgi:hypothetical protein